MSTEPDASPDGEEDADDDAAADPAPGDAAEEDASPTPVWRPVPGTSWQWQLTDLPIDRSLDVQMYDIDLFDVPQATIDALHDEGRIVICYFSAGSYEEWREDADRFPTAALGNELDGWAGERWLDVRDATVRTIMTDRLDLAVSKGCDGVEPDNVDGYTNDTGFPLTATDQLVFNRRLSNAAHRLGLGVALKNDGDQAGLLVDYYDFALNEECHEYEECEALQPFLDAGKPVLNAEYAGSRPTAASLASRVCPASASMGLRTVIYPHDLDGSWEVPCW